MCVTNLYQALVSLLSHHFSVSLTTVAMIQSRPTSTQGDGFSGYMVDVVLMPTGVLCWSAPHTSARGGKLYCCLPCHAFGFHSARLSLVNYYTVSTYNTEGGNGQQTLIRWMCETVCVLAFTVWAGGWFYMHVVQCLLIPMGHLSHLQFESLHAMGLSTHGLPFAPGCTLPACLPARFSVCVWLLRAVHLHMCFPNVKHSLCSSSYPKIAL